MIKQVQQLIISIGKCYQIIISISITKETLKMILYKQQKWGNDDEKVRLIKTIFFKGYVGHCVGMFYNVKFPTAVYRSSHP